MTVEGWIDLEVTDPGAFVADPSVAEAMMSVIAALAGVSPSSITVFLSHVDEGRRRLRPEGKAREERPPPRAGAARRAALARRRLQSGGKVRVLYSIDLGQSGEEEGGVATPERVSSVQEALLSTSDVAMVALIEVGLSALPGSAGRVVGIASRSIPTAHGVFVDTTTQSGDFAGELQSFFGNGDEEETGFAESNVAMITLFAATGLLGVFSVAFWRMRKKVQCSKCHSCSCWPEATRRRSGRNLSVPPGPHDADDCGELGCCSPHLSPPGSPRSMDTAIVEDALAWAAVQDRHSEALAWAAVAVQDLSLSSKKERASMQEFAGWDEPTLEDISDFGDEHITPAPEELSDFASEHLSDPGMECDLHVIPVQQLEFAMRIPIPDISEDGSSSSGDCCSSGMECCNEFRV
jgi:hypothetical protein